MLAAILLVVVGAMAGFFVVPMNALLQQRGHALLTAGRSIAVQGFNENAGVLLMLAIYAGATATQIPLGLMIWCFGILVAITSSFIMWQSHRRATRRLSQSCDVATLTCES